MLKLSKGCLIKKALNSNTIAIPDALSKAPGDLLCMFRKSKQIFVNDINTIDIQAPYIVK